MNYNKSIVCEESELLINSISLPSFFNFCKNNIFSPFVFTFNCMNIISDIYPQENKKRGKMPKKNWKEKRNNQLKRNMRDKYIF